MTAQTLPWHADAIARVRGALAADRLAHALLIHGLPGLGKQRLGDTIAGLSVCDRGGCGDCPSCRWYAAGNHPDVHRVAPIDDKKTISVDQIRALTSTLSLASLSGGRKVALIGPADAMTEAAANALLKTLEEPSGETTMILVAHRLSALPVTIVSRCQAVAVARPGVNEAVAWLTANGDGGDTNWPALLRLANGAPLAARALAADGFGAGVTALSDDLVALAAGRVDPGTVAGRWIKLDPSRSVAWLAQRICDLIRVRFGVAGRDVAHNLTPADLPRNLCELNVLAMFRYFDQVQTAARHLQTSLSAQQVVEALLVGWCELTAPALSAV